MPTNELPIILLCRLVQWPLALGPLFEARDAARRAADPDPAGGTWLSLGLPGRLVVQPLPAGRGHGGDAALHSQRADSPFLIPGLEGRGRQFRGEGQGCVSPSLAFTGEP